MIELDFHCPRCNGLLKGWQNDTAICFHCQLQFLKDDILKGNMITAQERASNFFKSLLKPEIIKFLSDIDNWNKEIKIECQFIYCTNKKIILNESSDPFYKQDATGNPIALPDHFHLWRGDRSVTFHWQCAFKNYSKHFFEYKLSNFFNYRL